MKPHLSRLICGPPFLCRIYLTCKWSYVAHYSFWNHTTTLLTDKFKWKLSSIINILWRVALLVCATDVVIERKIHASSPNLLDWSLGLYHTYVYTYICLLLISKLLLKSFPGFDFYEQDSVRSSRLLCWWMLNS